MQDRFDRQAREMDANPVIREMAQRFFLALNEMIPLNGSMNVLDYGCGSGLIGMHVCGAVGTLVMLDSSSGMLDILKEKIEEHKISNMKLLKGDISSVDFESGSFDLIYTNNVLHHIEDIESFIRKLSVLLKPGGHLCLGDLFTESGAFHDDHTGVFHFGFDPGSVAEVVSGAGLSDCHWKEYFVVKKPDKTGTLREYSAFILSACNAG